MNEALRTVSVSKTYPSGSVCALDSVSIEIARGEFVAIAGPSGSGKTTLLNLLGALDYCTSGKVFVDGIEIARGLNLDLLRAREIGFVFQTHNLIPTLTCRENVEMPMIALGAPSAARRRRALELLDQVGLSTRAEFLATRISGGERQRVAVARALANSPRVVLADEPTGNLDSAAGKEVMRLLQSLRTARGLTLVLVTHNPELAKLADRIVMLKDGRIVPADGLGV